MWYRPYYLLRGTTRQDLPVIETLEARATTIMPIAIATAIAIRVPAWAAIDRGLAGLPQPEIQGITHPHFPGLDGEIDQAGGPAECSRTGARFKIVARDCPAVRHVQVGVDIHTARDDVLARRIDDLVGPRLEVPAYGGDLFLFNIDVASEILFCCDDASIPDDDRHTCSF
jgi:hypothetical protein